MSIEEPRTETHTGDTIYTIGHSNHSIEEFISLLNRHGITAVVDVRSEPYSRFNPQFNKEPLEGALATHGIAYVFLGEELGARPVDPTCYENGQVNYERLASSDKFRRGLERLRQGHEKYRIAIMCAEKEPLDCHRTILICRHLRGLGVNIKHILHDGSLEDHRQAESELIRLEGCERGLFDQNVSDSEMLERAYNKRAQEISNIPDQGESQNERR
jgi:uncharacterized protein (DUF488 family)